MKRGGVGLDGRDKEEASRFGNRRHHLNGSTEARTLKGGVSGSMADLKAKHRDLAIISNASTDQQRSEY